MKGLKLSHQVIYDAIINLDFSSWTVSQLQQIRSTLPTKEERDLLKEYTGEVDQLAGAEQFLMKIIDIPQVDDLMMSIICKASFADKFEEISVNALIALGAAENMMTNKILPKFLEVILSPGNRH